MNNELTFDLGSFKGLEYAGWQKGAASYDDLFGSVTRFAMVPLLDATDVRAGSQVLEVCCGPGYGAGAALSRGASAVGIDFAPAMVEAARRRYPKAVFKQGDAEALDLDTGAFDAVICAFGINHLQRPESAIAEALRVLRPGGKYAFTMWCVPGKSNFISWSLSQFARTVRSMCPCQAPRHHFASARQKPAPLRCSKRVSSIPESAKFLWPFGPVGRNKCSILPTVPFGSR
jgi:ubiquinone/menaquinone biosynthesis C-methylase UbiE